MDHKKSLLGNLRKTSFLTLPSLLTHLDRVSWQEEQGRLFLRSESAPILRKQPIRIGVLFSGGPAPGGHNVVAGLYDALQTLNKGSCLIGFLGGPAGLLKGEHLALDQAKIDLYRNSGGFDLLGSGRGKIETEEELSLAIEQLQKLLLDGLVIIGGDDSNTNAAILAEYLQKRGSSVSVVGVPKTIDGDLQNRSVAISFGFDTACKVYAELVGNLAKDAASAKKYYHFVRLMGRSASHIVLEVALQTQPNCVFIAEEILAKKQSLKEIVSALADLICEREGLGKSFGVVLLPEGIIEAIDEIRGLIQELNALLAQGDYAIADKVLPHLTSSSKEVFLLLPKEMQEQLLLHRDPHGNVNVSAIESEKLLDLLVKKELFKKEKELKRKVLFSCVHHFFGYEARSAFPSYFDSHYTYALGYAAALLVRDQKNGYMAAITNLTHPVIEWGVEGVPLASLLHAEIRKGKEKRVIAKTLVQMQDPAFCLLEKTREKWRLEDCYLSPGPIQFSGEKSLVERVPLTLQLNRP